MQTESHDRRVHGQPGRGEGRIAERIARAHGGSICAESTPGQGTSMILDLPLAG